MQSTTIYPLFSFFYVSFFWSSVSYIHTFYFLFFVELAHSPHAKYDFIFFCRTSGVLYPKVHCSYKSLGESLMPNGEVDNFIIPCLCRVLFEEKHPSTSGRHYFFPNIGVGIFLILFFLFLIIYPLCIIFFCIFIFVFTIPGCYSET